MARAPADWRSVLRRAEVLVRRRETRCLDLLLPARRWRSLVARNRAVILMARMGPVAVPPLVVALEGARTATERWGPAGHPRAREGDSRPPQVRRQGRGRSVARLAIVTPRATGESLKQAAGLGRGAGSWSSGYDIALTWRRSPVRIRSSPLPFRTHLRLSTATFGGRVHPRKLVLLRFSSIGDEGEIGGARDDEAHRLPKNRLETPVDCLF